MIKLLKILVALTTLVTFSASPSYAGSGSDGIIKIEWKNIKKSQAKRCAQQRVLISYVNPVAPNSFTPVSATILNSDGLAISIGSGILQGSSNKVSDSFQFCTKLGPGPYTLNVRYLISHPRNDYISGEFDIRYKFKK